MKFLVAQESVQRYLPTKENRKFRLENQVVRAIPFGESPGMLLFEWKHCFGTFEGQVIYVQEQSCQQKFASKLFSQFQQKKNNSVITRKFCETPTSKYRKSSMNDQFKKILDLEREKPKNCPEKSANFAEIAKLTRIFLAL